MTIKLGLVGVGKIARDQHIPVLNQHPAFELSATTSSRGGISGVENFDRIETMLEARPDLTAVALCMPPQARYEAASMALAQGKHTLLEKPPGATQAEVESLLLIAQRSGATLYSSWHSRHAAAVAKAKQLLQHAKIESVNVDWIEDVRKWHPDQEWIWQPGGLGVFDPGINALSIVTEILPCEFYLNSANLTFPENKQAPIAAKLDFQCNNHAPISAYFDWRTDDAENWNIQVKTDADTLELANGGSQLLINGIAAELEERSDNLGEYIGVYDRFFSLIDGSKSDADYRPLTHVADAFLIGERQVSEAFD